MTLTPKNFKHLRQPKKPRKHNESDLQQQCVKWFDIQYMNRYTFLLPVLEKKKGIKIPIPKNVRVSALIMLANGYNRSMAARGIAIAEGLSTGAADLLLSVQQPCIKKGTWRKCGLYIEMKFGNKKQSVTQVAFQKLVEENGYQYAVINSFDAFKQLIEDYLCASLDNPLPKERLFPHIEIELL